MAWETGTGSAVHFARGQGPTASDTGWVPAGNGEPATVRTIARNEVSSRLCLRLESVGVNVLDVHCVVASDLKPFAHVTPLC